MEQQKLIFDIGMHQGEDLQFYLNCKAKVIALDADPVLIELAQRKFKINIQNNQLTLVNKAISARNDEELIFNLSSYSAWNSLDPAIAGRSVLDSLALGIEGKYFCSVEEIKVRSATLSSLMEQFGVPYYCKIDIEGMDDTALQSLKGSKLIPKFISVETECLGENKKIFDDEALKTLYSLQSLGYSKFMLIDQTSLQPLVLNKMFYSPKHKMFYYLNRVLKKLNIKVAPYQYRDKLEFQFNYTFPMGSSGPFGEGLKGIWYNFSDASKLLVQHRSEYFKMSNAKPYGFWCDWHATY